MTNLNITENSYNGIKKINALLDKYYDIESRFPNYKISNLKEIDDPLDENRKGKK